MNKIILVGRIAADLELKSTKNGKSVMTFPIAVNRKYKSEGYPTVDFFNVVVWAKQAEVIHQYWAKENNLLLLVVYSLVHMTQMMEQNDIQLK